MKKRFLFLSFWFVQGLFINGITLEAQDMKQVDQWYINASENPNLLPMYGYVDKAPEQLEDDKRFIHLCDSIFGDLKEASTYASNNGWEYFLADIYDTAMFRFNQAWLLDSTNVRAYWGFGAVYGKLGQLDESISFLEMAEKLDSTNAFLKIDIASNYMLKHLFTEDDTAIFFAEKILKTALIFNPKSATAFYKLSMCYYYIGDIQSAWNYLHQCRRIDGKIMQLEYVNALLENMADPDGFYTGRKLKKL